MSTVVTKTFTYGDHSVTLETGRVARQASSAVLVNMADTVVLVTVVGVQDDAKASGRDFFPLTVNYQERTYAAGRIPGGYFKREGRPTEKEVLTSRLIDRPIRPLFPEGFQNEVQIVATVLSVNPDIDPDIPSLLGASAALTLSGMPFMGPIAAARVGYRDNQYLLNPTYEALDYSDLDLVVAGTEKAVLMVESEALELSEEIMLGAVVFGHEQMQVAIKAIKEFAAEAGSTSWQWQSPVAHTEVQERLQTLCHQELAEAYLIKDKKARQQAVGAVRDKMLAALLTAEQNSQQTNATPVCENTLLRLFGDLESRIVRDRILDNGIRIDGRDTKTVRPITIQTGVLPRTHGTALFTRGETQALVVSTLGTARDAQIIDALEGETKETFMLHYNFPPYSVGETGQMGSPKRREIGHGRLAKRGIEAVLPSMEEFPYVLRVVSEITESNGSSSMATVCGTSLALMDAGVPIRSHVAGIAMGLIKEKDRYAVITDILGDEDHLGDMDFKVAGTSEGITALQMDIKIDGITKEIMQVALEQAKAARLHILELMYRSIAKPRTLSDFAPRIMTMKIHPDKIRDVIGKGGVTIRAITEETGATIDISDDGTVQIFAVDKLAGEAALQKIELITADPIVGQVYTGKVVKITDFGAFVAILPGREGLLHISQISKDRVERVTDFLHENQEVTVKLVEIDRQGRIRLSMKELAMAE